MVKKTITLPVEKISNISVASSPNVAKEDKEREKKWRAEDDIRTMQRAEEIKRDKERMKNMKSYAKSQMNDLKKIC